MKRLRLLVVLGAVAVALPLGLATAKATGGSGTTGSNSVSIAQDAQYDLLGGIIHVGLTVSCKNNMGAPGQVEVTVEQWPPETPYYMAAGGGLNNVVCDGKPHTVGVSVTGEGFDAGRAKATATLIPPVADVTHSVTTSKWITIKVMNRQ
jgi:hypothetical protein